jgi:hypothetical protein
MTGEHDTEPTPESQLDPISDFTSEAFRRRLGPKRFEVLEKFMTEESLRRVTSSRIDFLIDYLQKLPPDPINGTWYSFKQLLPTDIKGVDARVIWQILVEEPNPDIKRRRIVLEEAQKGLGIVADLNAYADDLLNKSRSGQYESVTVRATKAALDVTLSVDASNVLDVRLVKEEPSLNMD